MLSRFRGYVTAVVLFLTIVPATQAKYGGGTGEPNNPYLIYTAEHLNAIGVESNDWGKHFKLVADIDLSEFSYSTALIVPDTANNTAGFQGTPFTGIFDGNDHIISNLTIDGAGYLGLFGCLAPEGEIKDLELVDVNIVGSGDCVGGLVGQNGGILSQCRSTGGVSGDTEVGGLAGHNFGLVANCHSAGAISGIGKVGGLVGYNLSGQVLQCYSTGTVRASGWYVGGLLGSNSGYVLRCYSTGAVRGRYYAGGLVAINSGSIINCYSTGLISGIGPAFGGLVGSNTGIVIDCFWDTQATGLNRSEAGTGLTTIQMQDIQTYLDAGWDWAGQANDGISEVWQMPEEGGYPVLAVFSGYAPAELQGLGTAEDPYLVSEALELAAMVNYSPYGHYRLSASIDLSGIRWGTAVIPWFAGTFDGNSLTISNLTIEGTSYLGLFGQLAPEAEVKNLGLVDVNISGSGSPVGGLVGDNSGLVSLCYSKGVIDGGGSVGGMAGKNSGSVTRCYSAGGTILSNDPYVGGLVGLNEGDVYLCYSTNAVSGDVSVGGLIGSNSGSVTNCVWDIEASGQTRSAGGIGLTTTHMMNPDIYGLNGWALDPNWIVDSGKDYPRLAWEGTAGQVIPEPTVYWLEGTGAKDDPYIIMNADQLVLIGQAPDLWNEHFKLMADIDMAGLYYSMAPIAPDLESGNTRFQGTPFTGIFDGNGHTISHLTIMGGSYLGLFGRLASGAEVRNLGIVEVNINLVTGPGYNVGGLVGDNSGLVSHCYSTGMVGGSGSVGGLVGKNSGSVTHCYSAGGTILSSGQYVGGLVGSNEGIVSLCYSINVVSGDSSVGGIVGFNGGRITSCFWDVETSGQIQGEGGVGLTTAQMMDPLIYGLNGWGMNLDWVLDAGNDYPRLAWEGTPGQPVPEPTLDWLGGTGTNDDPYRIENAYQLGLIGKAKLLWDKHFKLDANIDLTGVSNFTAVIPEFTGNFNGNNHTISHLTITGGGNLGLFGRIVFGAEVYDLGLVDADVTGTGSQIGSLVGESSGMITRCYSTSTVSGDDRIGGLVGLNKGNVTGCYSTGSASGDDWIGGLVGSNEGNVTNCYSTCVVSGDRVGGLAASNSGDIINCFWNIETSGQAKSAGGIGLTANDMMDAEVYGLNGWALDPNWALDAGNDYPRLAWEGTPGQPVPEPTLDWLGGTGTELDPYQVANADQLYLIGKASILWDKTIELTEDIDLIGIMWSESVIPMFSGSFNGNSHVIRNLKITNGESYIGLFGRITPDAEVYGLGLVDADVSGMGYLGILAGQNEGILTHCYSTGTVSGDDRIGGLVGSNTGSLTNCYSTSRVQGDDYIGGLMGSNSGSVMYSYSTGAVSGNDDYVGGLVGFNNGSVTGCYSTGSASGDDWIGGLIGSNEGNVINCYSTCVVSGDRVGGLAASNSGDIINCFWNIETSGQAKSAGGIGLTANDMMDAEVYGLNGWALDPNWALDAGNDYPRLAWEGTPGQPVPEPTLDWLGGTGTELDPYQVANADQLYLIGKASILWDKAIELTEGIDLIGIIWSEAVIPVFSGSFNGNSHVIRNLRITNGESYIGLFGRITSDAEVYDLGLVDADVSGTENLGILAGQNDGIVTHCYSTGTVSGDDRIGGLVGSNTGSLTNCFNTSHVQGDDYVGGLVGSNSGSVMYSYSTGAVSGRDDYVGGLVGLNNGSVTGCYSTGSASGDDWIGGLVGSNEGNVINCYSTCVVSGDRVGGLAASNSGDIINCFWNIETSGQAKSAGGIGLTTSDMMDAEVYGLNRWALDPSWVLDTGNDYPRLAWEGTPGQPVPEPTLDWLGGTGTELDPYQVANADQLYLIGKASILWDKAIELTEGIDLIGIMWSEAVIPVFSGSFSGNGHVIRNLRITNGESYIGLFGRITSDAEVYDLGLVDADVSGTENLGILAGQNDGIVTHCYSTGTVSGDDRIGGLVGSNTGSLTNCFNTSHVQGDDYVGGLVGSNSGSVMYSYSTGAVSGRDDYVGGLVGLNNGSVTGCYSTGSASGDDWIGGLVGSNEGNVINCYSTCVVSGDRVGGLAASNSGDIINCFWNIETSGQAKSAGGIGLTTSDMMDAEVYGLNRWALDPSWVLDTGNDYPRLAWEGTPGQPVPEPTLDWLGGTGTELDPYQVANADQLYLIGKASILWDKAIELTEDIDLIGIMWSEAVIPVFSGSFSGNGHVIRNLRITNGESYIGLFGRITPDAEVYDLGLVDADVSGTENLGILAGQNDGIVINCYTTGVVAGGNNAGGLVGLNEGSLNNCYSTGAISGNYRVGGLVGSNSGSAMYSYSTGDISGNDDSVGGLMGFNSSNVTGCYSTGSASGDDQIGGLVGLNEGNVTNSYCTGNVSGDGQIGGFVGSNTGDVTRCYSTGFISGGYVGGLVASNSGSVVNGLWDIETSGQTQSEGGVGLTTSEMMDPEMCGLNGWAADPNWVLDAGNDYPRLAWEGLPGQLVPEPIIDWLVGMGTKEYPYQITDIDQLALIARASILWDDCIELRQDIDFSGKMFSTAVIPEFAGTFLGKGYVVRNLTISGQNNLGLFGEIHSEAQIMDLNIIDADVNGIGENIGILAGKSTGFLNGCHSTGTVSGNWNVGGLIGNSSGHITNCNSTGIVTGGSIAGGLLGQNSGDVTNSYSACAVSGDSLIGGMVGNNEGSVTNCSGTGTVSGGSSVGGLAGQNGIQMWSYWGRSVSPVGGITSILINCFSTGSVSGDNTVGGVVGSNNGRISNCYSTGDVLSDWCSGGLVGENSGNVLNCYSIGTVSNNDNGLVGRLVGQNYIVISSGWGGHGGWSYTLYGTVIDSFWDTGTSAVAESDGGDGLTTAQMQNIQTFLDAGWDFNGQAHDGAHEIWQMPDEGGYPVLSVFNGYEPPGLIGEGTSENPYLISTSGELGAISHNNTKAHYRLATDLDLSGITWSMAVIPSFAGNFDGNGFVVRGLRILRGDNIGLFGQITPEAEVYDLGIADADVAGGTHVGALAGLNDQGIVTGCYSTGNISGSVSTGGLIGYTNGGIVSDCYSTATVSGGLNGGGLVGYILNGDVVGCYSAGSVSGQDYVGGFVGDNSGNISNCYSSSTASGNNEVGGLAGVNNGSISRCYSTGAVSGNDLVGGLAGQNSSSVDNCYSMSAVSGNSNIGGLVGNNSSTVTNCYSIGTVSGNANVGGLAGLNNDQITDCFWDMETSGLSISSSGDGLSTAAMQNILVYLDCGWDFVGKTENGTEDIWFIDGQDYPRLSWEYEE